MTKSVIYVFRIIIDGEVDQVLLIVTCHFQLDRLFNQAFSPRCLRPDVVISLLKREEPEVQVVPSHLIPVLQQ